MSHDQQNTCRRKDEDDNTAQGSRGATVCCRRGKEGRAGDGRNETGGGVRDRSKKGQKNARMW